ncbi:hypothetical protein B0H13DRAFT_1941644, partial [Mycena leptocephala]
HIWRCYSQTPIVTLVTVMALALSPAPFRSGAFCDLIPYRRSFTCNYPTSRQFLELRFFECILFFPSDSESLARPLFGLSSNHNLREILI